MAELIEVVELLKREDGSVHGLGNSLTVDAVEAEKLVSAGTHKYSDVPLGGSQKKKKAAGAAIAEGVEDGGNRSS